MGFVCVSLLTHMRYIITISNETLGYIQKYKASTLALKNHDCNIATLEQTLLLPSGKARKGGRKELNDANVVRQHLCDENHKIGQQASFLLRKDVETYIKERCLDTLEKCADMNDSDIGTIYRAAFEALKNKESGRHTIRIENTLAGYGFDYDVFCTYSDHHGLCINVTKHNEGRFIGGGIINVRRKYQGFSFKDERFEGIEAYISDNGEYILADVPTSYVDGGYIVVTNNQDEQTPDEAQAMSRVMSAMAHICKNFGSLRLSCFDHIASVILYK